MPVTSQRTIFFFVTCEARKNMVKDPLMETKTNRLHKLSINKFYAVRHLF